MSTYLERTGYNTWFEAAHSYVVGGQYWTREQSNDFENHVIPDTVTAAAAVVSARLLSEIALDVRLRR